MSFKTFGIQILRCKECDAHPFISIEENLGFNGSKDYDIVIGCNHGNDLATEENIVWVHTLTYGVSKNKALDESIREWNGVYGKI